MRSPEGRGGMRIPRGGPRVSGVGRNARRSDTQAIDVPNVGDAEDLKHGDRQRLEAAMRQRPLARSQTPQVARQVPPRTPIGGMGMGEGGIPPLAFEMESKRPNEPVTAGMDEGPGAGSEVLSTMPPADDPRILAFERYARERDNPTAQRYLQRIYQQSAAPTPQTVALPEPGVADTGIPMEDDFGEEEVIGQEEAEEDTTPVA